MAITRKSTRQSTRATPKYNEDSNASSEEGAKSKSTRITGRKRAREQDEEDKAKPAPKKTANSNPKDTPAPPISSTETNRNVNGEQEVFWLLKAEPLPRYENGINVAFSIDDLAACTVPEPWSGVRNPQARNNMQAMRVGDLGFFYHSNAKPSGVVGILRVVEEAKVDESAFDKKDPYYDPKSDREKPKWYCVGVEFVKKFDDVVDLAKIKSYTGSAGPLEGMQLVTNSRLSVCRVRKHEWDFIIELAGDKSAEEAQT